MSKILSFNRFEFSGSMGDLGTLLPIGIGMVLVNQLSPSGIFFSVGILYLITGFYYRVPTSVQPMKVIAAYAISTSITPDQIQASCILLFLCLLFMGLTSTVDAVEKYTPKCVIKGVQFSTGVILMMKGVNFILGKSPETYATIQKINTTPESIIIGIITFITVLFSLNNKRIPAGITAIGLGIFIGLIFGINHKISINDLTITMPNILPLGIPKNVDIGFVLISLVTPQMPMTICNAVIANKNLSNNYFRNSARKVTNSSLCFTMAIGNLFSALLNGMPLCHGAGGLAAHYRFGARTAGSNLIIGSFFILLAIFLGDKIIEIFNILPIGTLGVLLLFSGIELALSIGTTNSRANMFVIASMLAVTLSSNLGISFLYGIIIAHSMNYFKTIKI